MPSTPNTTPSTLDAAPDPALIASRLRLALTRTARRLRQEAAGDLTPTTAAALATVERRGPLTPSELATAERVKRPTATRSLRCLLDAGLVDRTPDPSDGRSALVSITPEGSERLHRMRSRKNAYLVRLMSDLDADDAAALERAAAILEHMLESEPPPQSGDSA